MKALGVGWSSRPSRWMYASRISPSMMDARVAGVPRPFSLMAAALLTSPAKAISRGELLNALALYYQYLLEAEARFSETLDNFTKAMEDAIAFYRDRKLIEVEDDEDMEEPIYTLPEDQRLSLEMYKNMIIHHFLPLNFVSLSLLSADYGECTEHKLMEDYRFLKDVFRFDFIYDEWSSDTENIDRCLNFLERGRHVEIRSNEDGGRVSAVTPKGREEIVYFAAMMTNFLEAYGILFNALPSLQKKPETEKDFISRVSKIGDRLYKQGQVLRPEALSMLLYKNALQKAKQMGMVSAEQRDGKPPVLTFNSQSDDLRKQTMSHVSKFIRVEKYHYLEK